MPFPDCAWRCGRALTDAERVHGTEGHEYYICSCCAKTTRVDRDGIAHKVEPLKDVRDVNGTVMYGP